jgi:hypothetical protein
MSDTQGPVLDYRGSNLPVKWVTVRTYLNEFEANLAGNELEANGVRWQLLNEESKSMLGWYGAYISVRLQVHSDEVEKARAVLANHAAAEAGDLEPVEAEDPATPLQVNDEQGVPATWNTVAVFETARAMHEAAMVLESSHVAVLMPRLAPRGDRPPGEGPRFVLRVQADDVERAQAMLGRASEEREEGELQCPKCGSYSIHESKHEFTNLLLAFVGKEKPIECECMKCHYKGEAAEFGAEPPRGESL